jgi:hypothetical protein
MAFYRDYFCFLSHWLHTIIMFGAVNLIIIMIAGIMAHLYGQLFVDCNRNGSLVSQIGYLHYGVYYKYKPLNSTLDTFILENFVFPEINIQSFLYNGLLLYSTLIGYSFYMLIMTLNIFLFFMNVFTLTFPPIPHFYIPESPFIFHIWGFFILGGISLFVICDTLSRYTEALENFLKLKKALPYTYIKN